MSALSATEEAFVDEVCFVSKQALQSSSFFDFSLGSKTVRLNFSTQGFCDLFTPAFLHLRRDNSQLVDLVVNTWDSESTSLAMPNIPWPERAYLARGDIRGFKSKKLSVAYQLGSRSFSLFDKEKKEAFFWTSSLRKLPYWERAAPFRNIFQWWLEEQGNTMLHAAAVGLENKGALLVGRGGSGKSTTALSCLKASFQYLADDYCMISSGKIPLVHSLYNSTKVERQGLSNFGFLGNEAEEGSAKALFFLYPSCLGKLGTSLPIKFIFVPEITGRRETFIRPCSKEKALRSMAPSTIYQLAGTGAHAFKVMANLVRTAPCYTLYLGTDLHGVSEAIYNFFRTERAS